MTTEAAAKPRITLEFEGPGMANVTARFEGVSPAQLYAAAWYLDAVARGNFADAKVAAAMEHQALAALAAGIRNGGRG